MKKSKINPEVKNIIEAALLVAGEPLTPERLVALFPEGSRPTRDDVRAVLELLEKDYEDRGIELRQIDKGWRIQTREKYASYVAKAVEARPPRYTRALLETLAIIAYRQPVTRGDIEEIRGVAVSTDTIRILHDREWVREVGRREVPGRPVLYGTTRQFLEHFNLKTLEDMPPLSELRPIEEIGAELDRRLAQNPGDVSRPSAGEDSGSLSAEPAAMEAAPSNRGE